MNNMFEHWFGENIETWLFGKRQVLGWLVFDHFFTQQN